MLGQRRKDRVSDPFGECTESGIPFQLAIEITEERLDETVAVQIGHGFLPLVDTALALSIDHGEATRQVSDDEGALNDAADRFEVTARFLNRRHAAARLADEGAVVGGEAWVTDR